MISSCRVVVANRDGMSQRPGGQGLNRSQTVLAPLTALLPCPRWNTCRMSKLRGSGFVSVADIERSTEHDA